MRLRYYFTENDMRLRRVAGALLVILSPTALAGQTASAAPPLKTTAIVGVTVIDVERGVALPGRTVIVRGNRITAVLEGTAAVTRAPTSDTVTATAKFVIPGLWDMHVHSAYPLFPAVMGPQYIANGVTGVREMFGDLPTAKAWRATLASTDTVWPRIIASGHIVDGKPPIWPTSVEVTTAEQGARAVDSLKAAGTDFIKVYSLLPRAAYFGVAKRAKEVGIPFVGHVTMSVTDFEASDAGQKSIEHMDGMLRACSSDDAAMRASVVPLIERGAGYDSLMTVSRPQAARIRATQSVARCDSLARTFKRNGTWVSPTLTVLHGIAWADDTTQLSDPRLKYLPKFLWARWTPAADFRMKSITPEQWAGLKADFALNQQLVATLHRAGVGIIAGTDMLNPWVFPGWSLHDELARYVDAGLTPIEALRTATVNPARFLGATDSLGAVAVGKIADFVVLDANPLVSIGNTKRVWGVMANGRWVSSDRSAAMLEKVATMVAPPAPRRP